MEIKQTGVAPLYYLLQERIREDIENGIYIAGEQIPAEPELQKIYQVSRITVRRAVEELCKEGLLEKRHGKGTFVRPNKIHRKIEHLMSFSEASKANGMEASSILVSKGIMSGLMIEDIESEEFQELCCLEGQHGNGGESTPVQNMNFVCTRRIRLADGEPVMLENNYFPSPRYDFLMNEDISGSLYEMLQKKHKIVVTSSSETYLDIARAGSEVAALLKVSKGEPLFLLHTRIFDQHGRLIHVGHQYINSDYYRFYLDK